MDTICIKTKRENYQTKFKSYLFIYDRWFLNELSRTFKRDLKQSSQDRGKKLKQVNFSVRKRPQTDYTYCIFKAYFMIKSL